MLSCLCHLSKTVYRVFTFPHSSSDRGLPTQQKKHNNKKTKQTLFLVSLWHGSGCNAVCTPLWSRLNMSTSVDLNLAQTFMVPRVRILTALLILSSGQHFSVSSFSTVQQGFCFSPNTYRTKEVPTSLSWILWVVLNSKS